MTKIYRIVFPSLLFAAGAMGLAHAGPAVNETVQVEVRLAEDKPLPPAQVYAELEHADMSEHLDPLAITGIAGAIGVYSIVSAIRRRRAEQQGCPKLV